MRSIVLFAAALVILSAPARAQPPDPTPSPADSRPLAEAPVAVEAVEPNPLRLHVAIGAMMAAQGADLATTMYALGTRRYEEVNPAFDWLTHTPWVAGAVKMAVAAGFSYLMLREHKQHPRLTFWVTVVAAASYSALAVHNARATR